MSADTDTPGEDSERVEYDPGTGRYDIYECPECDTVTLAVGRGEPAITCHGEPMEQVTDLEMSVEPPGVKRVLFEAFGLPKVGLDICLRVVGDGPLSASELAETLGYDRSTVTRYLNDLVGLGLLQRSELNREDGGVVNVYHSIDLERMRRETLVGFLLWAGEAVTLIEEANLAKRDQFEENPGRQLPDVFWKSFSDS